MRKTRAGPSRPPSKLALKLAERMQTMFGKEFEPKIYRHRASYYTGRALAYKWSMRTRENRYRVIYEVTCYETALSMGQKNEWRALDGLLGYVNTEGRIGKTIY